MKKPITIISTISIVLFMVAVIGFAVGLYNDKKNGTQTADERYERLLAATKENFSKNPYGTGEFANNFIRAIGNVDDFSELKLEVNDTLVYSYPPAAFSIPSPGFVKSYRETVYLPDSSFTLRTSVYLMRPDSIYRHSRLAFLLILIGTIIMGIFIVLYNGTSFDHGKRLSALGEKRPAARKAVPNQEETASRTVTEKKEGPAVTEDSPPADEPEDIQAEESGEDAAPLEDDGIFEPEGIGEPAEDNDGFDIIDQLERQNMEFSESSFLEDSADDEDSPHEETSTEIQEIQGDARISPVTSLNLQSSLEEKLDEAIGQEDSVSLALIKINGLDRGNEISRRVIAILGDSAENAVLFEYKGDSYAVIFKGEGLQSAVDKSESIYNKISDYLKNNDAANEVSIGISSAGSRKITADRLMLEADQALDYASKDPDSPIVAFRANPEKYKEFEETREE